MSAERIVEKLTFGNINRNRPSMRHQFQDTVEDSPDFEPDRHEFIRTSSGCVIEESQPTGRTRISADSPILKTVFPAHVAGNIDSSQRVYRIHGEAGFFIS